MNDKFFEVIKSIITFDEQVVKVKNSQTHG